MKQFRQGDVWIEEVDFLPPSGKKKNFDKGRLILADGEITGHHHVVCADDIDAAISEEDAIFFKTNTETKITHEEHAPIILEPNKVYKTYIQREYDENAEDLTRKVID
jgi:hypothetical protein